MVDTSNVWNPSDKQTCRIRCAVKNGLAVVVIVKLIIKVEEELSNEVRRSLADI